MVTSVTAVSDLYKTRREDQQDPYSHFKKQNAEGLFAKVLEENVKEIRENAMNCCTTTYGRDSKMQTYLYQKREYRH